MLLVNELIFYQTGLPAPAFQLLALTYSRPFDMQDRSLCFSVPANLQPLREYNTRVNRTQLIF